MKKVSNVASSLYQAFDFIKSAQRENGVPFMRHSEIKNKTLSATDGVLTMSHPVEEEIEISPNTFEMMNVLSECGDSLSIVQLETDRLFIKSDKIEAYVACIPNGSLGLIVKGDPPCYEINDNLKKSFKICNPLISETTNDFFTSSLSLTSGNCTSTNRTTFIQNYHGIDLPTVSIPKQAVNFIEKCTLPLSKLGYSNNSVTFYFQNGAWIKTQIFEKTWPDVSNMFKQVSPAKYPEGFFKAIKAAKKFSKDGYVYLSKDRIGSSSENRKNGISYKIEGINIEKKYSIQDFQIIEKCSNKIHFHEDGNGYFFDDNTRGIIAGIDHA